MDWLTFRPVVLAQYLFRINGHTPSTWELKGTAVAGYTVAVLRRFLSVCGRSDDSQQAVLTFNTRAGFLLSNGIGIVKVITLIL